jgi:hypothetical protein
VNSSQRQHVELEFVDPLKEAAQIEAVCLESATAASGKECAAAS